MRRSDAFRGQPLQNNGAPLNGGANKEVQPWPEGRRRRKGVNGKRGRVAPEESSRWPTEGRRSETEARRFR